MKNATQNVNGRNKWICPTDLQTTSGKDIPIEDRPGEEIIKFKNGRDIETWYRKWVWGRGHLRSIWSLSRQCLDLNPSLLLNLDSFSIYNSLKWQRSFLKFVILLSSYFSREGGCLDCVPILIPNEMDIELRCRLLQTRLEW